MKEAAKRGLQIWGGFALLYLAVAVLSLTLIPLKFESIAPFYGWAYRFTLEDFARNILLFLPFGIVARYAFRQAHWTTLICGLLFSFSIEVTQLFIGVRTSNVADILGNGSGALLGSILCQKLLSKYWTSAAVEIPLGFVFVPLCWIGALRSLTDPFSAPLTLFSFLTGLILIQISPPRQPFPFLPAAFWLAIAIIPFFNTQPSAGIIFTAAAPIALYATATQPAKLLKPIAAIAALLGTSLTLLNTGLWYFSSSAKIMEFQLILHASEIVLSAVAAVATLWWYRTES